MAEDSDLQIILSPETFGTYIDLIHKLTGIHIGASRINMVQGRFRKRIAETGQTSFEKYLDLVKKDDQEKLIFIDLITTNETQFFRTPRIWQYIEDIFLPQWHAVNPKSTFMAWSAAASSGEEAHSLGVLLQQFKEKNISFNYQIIGTDISQEMIQLSQEGIYSNKSVQAFKTSQPQKFNKYMRRLSGEKYQTISEIKSRIRFLQHNLFNPFTEKNKFDLVLIRNVLIYFTPIDQEKVLHLVTPHLSEQGILIVGESESLSHIQSNIHYIEPFIYGKNKKGKAA